MIPLKLRPDGVLEHTEWQYDETTDTGEYVTVPVNSKFQSCLNVLDKFVTLDTDVTLRSAFELLAETTYLDSGIWNYLFNNCYVGEFIEYYVANRTKTVIRDDQIHHLEIYRMIDKDSITLNTDWNFRADFHGVGSGEGAVNWGVSYCDVFELMDIPLQLNNRCPVHEENHDIVMSKLTTHSKDVEIWKPLEVYEMKYTLRQMLHAIFWELSWTGSPTSAKYGGKYLADIE